MGERVKSPFCTKNTEGLFPKGVFLGGAHSPRYELSECFVVVSCGLEGDGIRILMGKPSHVAVSQLGRAVSTPNLCSIEVSAVSGGTSTPPTPPRDERERSPPRLEVSVSGATMVADEEEELVVLYSIVVHVGNQELGGAQRRYREFDTLRQTLEMQYPRLIGPDSLDGASHRHLPPFPRKYRWRARGDPEVVVERVAMLRDWLSAVAELLQFASVEMVSFINVPLYAAIRLLSGDLQADDFTEPCSPESVVTKIERDASTGKLLPPTASKAAGKAAGGIPGGAFSRPYLRSPATDRRSLNTLASQLQHSVHRPGYNESAWYVARAICAHTRAAAASPAADLDDAHRFVRAVCGRALFKPCSLIATVVYMERVGTSPLHALIRTEGWQLTLLTLLVIAAKVWDSDYPISNADICVPTALLTNTSGRTLTSGDAERPLCARRVCECERRVLGILDYRTLVSQAEFARFYLTLPLAFPDAPDEVVGGGPGAACPPLLSPCIPPASPKGGYTFGGYLCEPSSEPSSEASCESDCGSLRFPLLPERLGEAWAPPADGGAGTRFQIALAADRSAARDSHARHEQPIAASWQLLPPLRLPPSLTDLTDAVGERGSLDGVVAFGAGTAVGF